MFAKFINEKTVVYPDYNKGSDFNYFLDENALSADGYKKLVPETLPYPGDMICPEIRYREGENEITQYYAETYTAPPEPTYEEKRAEAYLPVAEQLDMMYWDKKNSTNNWEEHIDTVKAAYPKPVIKE